MILIEVAFFFLGAIIASFLGVISERIYTGQSWLKGRSRCNSCRRQLNVFDLVPVFSWLSTGGRCRTCKIKLPIGYVLFEALLGVVFLVSYVQLGITFNLVVFLCAVTILGFIVLYDLRHTIVPVTASGLLIAFSVVFAIQTTLSILVFGIAILIGLGFFLLYALSRGRAMGLGDAPVAFALSLLVGHQAVSGLMFSFWIGAIVGVWILVTRRGGPTMGIEVPFVPFLAMGYLLAFFTQWNPFIF